MKEVLRDWRCEEVVLAVGNLQAYWLCPGCIVASLYFAALRSLNSTVDWKSIVLLCCSLLIPAVVLQCLFMYYGLRQVLTDTKQLSINGKLSQQVSITDATFVIIAVVSCTLYTFGIVFISETWAANEAEIYLIGLAIFVSSALLSVICKFVRDCRRRR